MKDKKYKKCFTVSDNIKLKDENKLFIGKTHLFTCHQDAVTLVKSAMNNMNRYHFFNIEQINKDIHDCEAIKSSPDSYQFIYDIVIYLLKCGVFKSNEAK